MSKKRTPRMKSQQRRWPTAVDLYCGCGGVTAGLKMRHFRVVAAVDHDLDACETYRQNHPTVRLYDKDICNVNEREIRDTLLNGEDLDLLTVCAPCQPFSSQNKASSEEDDRKRLILHAIRFAETLNPKVIFFENVTGLTRGKFACLLTELRDGLTAIGYLLSKPQKINAADYSVPQRRWRWIMLAKKAAPPPGLPEPTTPVEHRVTVKHVLGNLPSLQAGEKDSKDPLHFARNHHTITLERLSYIPKDGGSRDALPDHLTLRCHKNYDGHPDVYGRMKWNDVAPTLTTGCTDLTRGRFAHPEQDRAITLREAARLQTFSDSYCFSGSAASIATQIGNAVPVRLIYELTPMLRNAIRD